MVGFSQLSFWANYGSASLFNWENIGPYVKWRGRRLCVADIMPVHIELSFKRERLFSGLVTACEKFFQMGTAPIFSKRFSGEIIGKLLVVNSAVENSSIHTSEKKNRMLHVWKNR